MTATAQCGVKSRITQFCNGEDVQSDSYDPNRSQKELYVHK